MSYQKKSLILQELEQAIRKKAQQKSRHKDQANKVLQSSIEKKKNTVKNPNVKDSRIAPVYKAPETISKPNRTPYQALSLFNNEQLNTIEGAQFKFKKYNNRRFDKLVSLIQYMVSSSEKAIKYISSTNFQAEFALKLYRSDKENLMNQLKTLNIEDILQHRTYDKEPNKLDINSLLEQNTKLKKEVLILEKQAQRFHQKQHPQELQSTAYKHWHSQISKLQTMLKKLLPLETFKQVFQLLQREKHLEQMLTSAQESSKKITQIQTNINSLQNERLSLIDASLKIKEAKIEGKSQKTYRLTQIQEQKQNLQRQIANLKSKLNQIKQSSRSIAQTQLLKKNSELVNEQLSALFNDLSKNGSTPSKRNSQQLIELIRTLSLKFMQGQQDLSLKLLQADKQAQILKCQNLQYRKYKKENQQQFSLSEEKMEKMIKEIQQFKTVIEQLQNDRDSAVQHNKQLQTTLHLRQQQIQNLSQRLSRIEVLTRQNQQLLTINAELKKQLNNWTKKCDERDKVYKEKINKSQSVKNSLEDRILQMAEELQNQRNQIASLKQTNKVADKAQTSASDLKIQFQKRQMQTNKILQECQRKLDDQTVKFDQLKSNYEETVNQIIKISRLSNQKSSRIQQQDLLIQQLRQTVAALKLKLQSQLQSQQDSRIQDLQEQNSGLREQINILRVQYSSLVQKSKISQNEAALKVQTIEELNKQNLKLKNKIQQLEQLSKKYSNIIQQQSKNIQTEDSFNQRKINQLNQKLQTLLADIHNLRQERDSLQTALDQNKNIYQTDLQLINQKLSAQQLFNTQINQNNQGLTKTLDSQRKNTASLTQQNEHQSVLIQTLRQQIASLSRQIDRHVADYQQSEQMLSVLMSEKDQLSTQLSAAKQQIDDQLNLNHHKMQQYVNLLKQILKGLQIESEDLADKNTFEQLLEFGSKQVVQMRKRLRDEASNQRKNSKKQKDYNEYQLQMGQHNNLQVELSKNKVQLFGLQSNLSPISLSEKSNLPKIEARAAVMGEQHDLNEFNEFHNEEMNNSIVSQDNNPNQFNIEQFADHEERMNSSVISQKEVQHIQQLNNQKANILKPLSASQLQVALEQQKAFYNPDSSNSPEHSPPQPNTTDDKIIVSLQSSQPANKSNALPQMSKNQSQLSESKKHNDFKLNDLDQFEEAKSDQMNESLVSQQVVKDGHRIENDQDLSQQLGSQLEKTIKESEEEAEDNNQATLKTRQNNFMLNAFAGNFFSSDHEDDELDDSVHSQDQRGLSEFAQVNYQSMADSIVSNQEAQHGLSQFGEVQHNQMNDSVVSEQNSKPQNKSLSHKFSLFEQKKYAQSPYSPSQKNRPDLKNVTKDAKPKYF